MALKPDQERVKNLLTETLTLLCKNGLTFETEMKVEGVIGVTVDKDVFIVHVNETYKNPNAPKSSSPDVIASDVAPPGFRERDRSDRQRRQAAGMTSKQTQSSLSSGSGSEVFVDLTSPRSNPGSPTGRQLPVSPRNNARMMGGPVGVTNRRGPYSPYQSPRGGRQMNMSPGGGRFRAPTSPVSPLVAGRGRRFMSPPQPRGLYGSSRQTFSPMQQSPVARRSLNMNPNPPNQQPGPSQNPKQSTTPPHPQQQQQQQQQQASKTPPANDGEDVVIVLDEPAATANNDKTPTPPTSPTNTSGTGRVLGQVITATVTDESQPINVEPVTIEPDNNDPACPSESSSSPSKANASSPTIDVTSKTATAGASNQGTTEPNTERPQSPGFIIEVNAPSSPLVAAPSESEAAIDDSLSKLASGILDKQQAFDCQSDTPESPKTTESLSDDAVVIVPSPTGVSPSPTGASPTPETTESTIATLQEVAKSTVAELKKTSVPTASASTDNTESSMDEGPTLSVSSIEGNFTSFDNLGTFRAVKKQPPEDDMDDQPPAKKRAVSPTGKSDSETPSSDCDSKSEGRVDNNETIRNGDLATVKAEKVDSKESKPCVTDPAKRKNMSYLSMWQVREMLESHIVTPVLKKSESTVTAFRMFWKGSQEDVDREWHDIILRRRALDDLVAKEKNLSFFISSVTAENSTTMSFPCIGYWVVTRHPAFDKEAFVNRMKAASPAAEFKMVLEVDGGDLDEFGSLCLMVKDYGDDKIQKQISDSAKSAGVANHPNVRFVLREKFFEHMLKNAMKHLRPASFTASLEKVV